jgi:hypothetical protein
VDGRQFELGVAALNLKKLLRDGDNLQVVRVRTYVRVQTLVRIKTLLSCLRDGDNLQDFTLMPESDGASVGKVVLSLYFIQALKELNVDGKQAASVSSGGAGGGGDGAGAGRAGSAAGGGGGSSSGGGSDGAGSGGGSGASGSGAAKTSATTSEGGVTKKYLANCQLQALLRLYTESKYCANCQLQALLRLYKQSKYRVNLGSIKAL